MVIEKNHENVNIDVKEVNIVSGILLKKPL